MSNTNKSAMRPLTHVHQLMGPLGLVMWFAGAVRFHADGEGIQDVWRAWHPMTWVFLALMVVPCAITGVRLSKVVPVRLSQFWKDNSDQLQWVTPFTRLDTLKPFVHRRMGQPAPALRP